MTIPGKHYWVRTRVTQPLRDGQGFVVRCILGERDDGGVFFQMTHRELEPSEMELELAQLSLDFFLDHPLSEEVKKSIGTFDVEPNFYIPGMSPGKV